MNAIETKRLILRNFNENDYEDLYQFLSQRKFDLFESYPEINYENGKEHLAYRLNNDEFIAIVLKETNKVIGNVYLGNRNFNAKEIGFIMNKEYQRKGYMNEACQEVIGDCFSHEIHRIFAECNPKNDCSRGLLEHLGFQKEAFFKQNVSFKNDDKGNPIYQDTYVYSLLNNKANLYNEIGDYMAYLSLKNVQKSYENSIVKVEALKDISFELEKGEFVVILGQSGAGKTTLLNLLGGMDNVSSGQIILDGKEISNLNKKKTTEYRRYDVGFIFQFYNLVNSLTAKENVELALEICKDALDPKTVLKSVGLEERMNNFPSQLSGGEQQRVSIARALAKKPKLLLCDEPTGALDYETGKKILELLYNVSKEQNRLVIVVTHNQALKAMADKVINIRSGVITSIEENQNPTPISEIEW